MIIPKTLQEFASSFSKAKRRHNIGNYISGCGNYELDYIKENKGLNTDGRIRKHDGMFEIDQSKVSGKSSDYVYFIIISLWAVRKLAQDSGNKFPYNYINSDIIAIKHCAEKGLDIKSITEGALAMFSNVDSELNKVRGKALIDYKHKPV